MNPNPQMFPNQRLLRVWFRHQCRPCQRRQSPLVCLFLFPMLIRL
jgi:hypothetical protein